MKNKEYQKMLVMALTASLTIGGAGVSSIPVWAAKNPSQTWSIKAFQMTQEASEKADDQKAETVKDETVYVKLDGSGKVMSVTVSDQLKNVSGLESIEDVSNLKNIENVKGEESFTQNGGKLMWNGDGKDIVYQGTTEKELPVGIRVTYTLDGREISAGELEGKSGHLIIRYEYENITGDGSEAYTPFLMVTGLILNMEKFSNVTIENGKLVSDGDRDLAIGMGIPKMKDALNVADIDIPDYFVLEADVTDYEAVEGITVATNEVFNSMNSDGFDSLEDLEGSMDQLQSAANQLVDGSGQLKTGLDTLLSSSGTLIDGIGQLAAGGDELEKGTGTLVNGAGELSEGGKALAGGTSRLAAGAENLSDGASQLAAGAESARKSTSEQLLPGVQQLYDGVTGMQSQVENGVGQLSDGTSQLKDGIETAADGAARLAAGIEAAGDNAGNLSTELGNAAASSAELAAGIQGLADSLSAAGVNNSDLIAAVETLRTEENGAIIDNIVNGLNIQADNINGELSNAAAMAGVIAGKTDTLSDGLSAAADGAGALSEAINGDIKNGAVGLSSALNEDLSSGAAQLDAGVTQMAGQLKDGTSQLASGTGALLSGTKDLNDGLGTLADGAAQVSEGSHTLSENMKTADDGAQTLAAGLEALVEGASNLQAGAVVLNSGLGTLQSGSGELVDGVTQLDNGAAELNSGMIQFNQDGIQKLVSAFDGDVESMLDNLNEILDASKEYNNFSGISDKMEGEVKFIFITDK